MTTLRFDQLDDYVTAFARSVNYFSYVGRNINIWVFQWSIGFNYKEEMTNEAVWISLLILIYLLRRSFLSIVASVRKQ